MPQDAIMSIKNDHRTVEQLFEALGIRSGSRAELVGRLCQELTLHAEIEEQILYPEMRQMPDGQRLVDEAEKEHAEVKDLIARLEAGDPESDESTSLVLQLQDSVTHHVEEEEGEMLPNLREHVGEARLQELGAALAAAKQEAKAGMVMEGMAVLTGSAAVEDQPRATAVAEDGLESMTKQELYDQAKEAGVEGRSSMKKDDLIRVLQHR